MYDAISGESVAYQYDSLNRLISAAGSGWTQTQAYDGFGNLTGRTGTGTAQSTTISTPVNATTNQLSGYSYDSNGNLISTGYTYDVENRISFANAGGVQYFYDAQNKRVWQATCLPGSCTPGGTWILNSATVNLFGADGKQLASYGPIPAWNNMTTNQVAITFGPVAVRSYFGGKLVGQQLGTNIYEPVIQDRLGSVGKYYPYGEERNSPQLPNDQVKFATYTRDSATGNDYADQRYYTSTLGRFMTPDPYQASVSAAKDPTDPQSWNRYPYSGSDPVNHKDPTGMDWCWGDDFSIDCLVSNPNGSPAGFEFDISIENAIAAALLAAENLASKITVPDCTVKISFRSVAGTPDNHIIITTIVSGVQTVYEGEPDPNPVPNAQIAKCLASGLQYIQCITSSLLVGVTTPNGTKGTGTPDVTLANAGWACAAIAIANSLYNNHPLHYVIGQAPNSNSYAYTLLSSAGLLDQIGAAPPNTPGWGYNVITNPLGYQ